MQEERERGDAGYCKTRGWLPVLTTLKSASTSKLVVVYLLIGVLSNIFMIIRSLLAALLDFQSSKHIFSQLINSPFRAPMSFYDSTPLGRILSRVSSDLSIVDLDISFNLTYVVGSTICCYMDLIVLTSFTWQVLFVTIPMAYVIVKLQKHYYACAKELMRMNGTTKSSVANHVAKTFAGATTIRAIEEEDQTAYAVVLASAALCLAMLPFGTLTSRFIGMALSYGLSLNGSLIYSIQSQCIMANYIVSVERIKQYTDIPSEAQEGSCPLVNWPIVGKVEIRHLQIRYRPNEPLVLHGITCTFEGGHKIGIVGRNRQWKINSDRSSFGIIPQDPTLFIGTIRYNLDPLSQHSDQEIWEVLQKCQLRESVKDKGGLDSSVVEDGSNWSIGQRQLFCLGRALLRRSKILVLDEATASIDNATDLILQNTIRKEFADCTVIIVAHRIPTVMNCNMVLSISDGKLVEYDEPMKLMKREKSLFGQLVKEYWSHFQ
ncbi:hypothetical protein P8452_22334 [Trifolium repens]|nr:hypothetical protein P8452_22334 [Trifolium repens]